MRTKTGEENQEVKGQNCLHWLKVRGSREERPPRAAAEVRDWSLDMKQKN